MPARRKAGPSRGPFSHDENERLRVAIDRMVDDLGTQVAVGEALGVGQSTIAGYLKGRTGVGGEVAGRIAKHFGYNSLLAFFGEPEVTTPTADKYPSRGRVVIGARAMGVSDAAIDALRKLTLKPGRADAPILFWLKQLVRILDEENELLAE